jgi:hypothetical protein
MTGVGQERITVINTMTVDSRKGELYVSAQSKAFVYM